MTTRRPGISRTSARVARCTGAWASQAAEPSGILVRRQAEQQHAGDAFAARRGRFADGFVHREVEHPRHRGNLAADAFTFADEERVEELFGRKSRLAHQRPQRRRPAGGARPSISETRGLRQRGSMPHAISVVQGPSPCPSPKERGLHFFDSGPATGSVSKPAEPLPASRCGRVTRRRPGASYRRSDLSVARPAASGECKPSPLGRGQGEGIWALRLSGACCGRRLAVRTYSRIVRRPAPAPCIALRHDGRLDAQLLSPAVTGPIEATWVFDSRSIACSSPIARTKWRTDEALVNVTMSIWRSRSIL